MISMLSPAARLVSSVAVAHSATDTASTRAAGQRSAAMPMNGCARPYVQKKAEAATPNCNADSPSALPISGAAIPIAPRSTKFSSTANASSPTSKAMTGRAGVMVCVVMLAPGACLRRAILWGVSAKVTHGRPPGTDRGTPLPFAAPFQANCRLGHTQTTESRPRQVA